MKRKRGRMIIAITALVVSLCAAQGVYAANGSSGTGSLKLPGIDLVGNGTGSSSASGQSSSSGQLTSSGSSSEGSWSVTAPATTDMTEALFFVAVLTASVMFAGLALSWFQIERKRDFRSWEHEKQMEEFRRSCFEVREMYSEP